MAGLTTFLALTTAASAGSTFIGSRKAAKGVERAGAHEQAMAEQNALFAEQQAEDALMRGKEAVSRHRMDVRRFAGSQRARLAAQGIDIGVGTAADILGETSYFGELDAITLKNNALREAWGYRAQATNYRNQGGFAGLSARTQAASLRNQGWSALLTGGAQVYDIYRSR
jgi:hypothetical protein